MTTNNSDYYNYDEEDEHLYDYNKEYDFTNYDELLDGIIDKLQIYGCQHHIDHIEDFLTDYGDLTLAEWSRDLMDPSISDFTLDYIMILLNNKYGTPLNTTLLINNKTIETPTSLHETGKTTVQSDKKVGCFNNNKI